MCTWVMCGDGSERESVCRRETLGCYILPPFGRRLGRRACQAVVGAHTPRHIWVVTIGKIQTRRIWMYLLEAKPPRWSPGRCAIGNASKTRKNISRNTCFSGPRFSSQTPASETPEEKCTLSRGGMAGFKFSSRCARPSGGTLRVLAPTGATSTICIVMCF